MAIPQQASGRIQRWALTFVAYEYTIAFCPTATHSNIYALRRLPIQCQEEQVSLVPKTILMLEQVDDSPSTAQQIKYFTARVTGPDICTERLARSSIGGATEAILASTDLTYVT